MISVDHPEWLWGLLLLPMLMVWSKNRLMSEPRRTLLALGLRSLAWTLVLLAAADVHRVQRSEDVATIVILDRTQSIPDSELQHALDTLALAADNDPERQPEDRLGVLAGGAEPAILEMPVIGGQVRVPLEPSRRDATDLGAAVATALSILPDDARARLVLASDGVDTEGTFGESVARATAAGIPIDVFPIQHQRDAEVRVESVAAPTRVRPGQRSPIRIAVLAQRPTAGTLRLFRSGIEIDLDPSAPGMGLSVELPEGRSVWESPQNFEGGGTVSWRAVFEPSSSQSIDRPENNVGTALTFVEGEGRVLLLETSPDAAGPLAEALRASGLEVSQQSPEAAGADLSYFAGFDLVVLSNVPRWSFTDGQDAALSRAVTELGVGLLTVGGSRSFGAGGWLGSELADVFPIDCQPPQTKELPGGAIAMVMHSCEMPEGNYWGRRVAEAAIETLHPADFVGMVEFDWSGFRAGDESKGCRWVLPMQRVGDRKSAFAATAALTYGDMPDFDPSMKLAIAGLAETPAAMRQIIVISDGDPSPPTPTTLAEANANRVQVTTVMVGGHGSRQDQLAMEATAISTGGRFFKVDDPNKLPAIFIREARRISRSLIQEGVSVTPSMQRGLVGGPLDGLSALPPVRGWVLTGARGGTASLGSGVDTGEDEPDPLVAWWSAGAGRSVAITTDAGRVWANDWVNWPEYDRFWEQLARWAMRPGQSREIALRTDRKGERAVVEIETIDDNPTGLLRRFEAVAVGPQGQRMPLKLRQVGPRRWRGEFPLRDEGSWLVSVAGRRPGEASIDRVLGAIDMPYPEEFRALRDNVTALERAARRTSGRVLNGTESLFTRDGLAFREARLPVWDIALILSALVFLLDVAVRRLALDWSSILRRGPVEAPETTLAGRVAAGDQRERVAKARGVDGQVESPVVPHASAEPDAQPPPSPEPKPTDRSAAMQRLLDAKRKSQRGDEP